MNLVKRGLVLNRLTMSTFFQPSFVVRCEEGVTKADRIRILLSLLKPILLALLYAILFVFRGLISEEWIVRGLYKRYVSFSQRENQVSEAQFNAFLMGKMEEAQEKNIRLTIVNGMIPEGGVRLLLELNVFLGDVASFARYVGCVNTSMSYAWSDETPRNEWISALCRLGVFTENEYAKRDNEGRRPEFAVHTESGKFSLLLTWPKKPVTSLETDSTVEESTSPTPLQTDALLNGVEDHEKNDSNVIANVSSKECSQVQRDKHLHRTYEDSHAVVEDLHREEISCVKEIGEMSEKRSFEITTSPTCVRKTKEAMSEELIVQDLCNQCVPDFLRINRMIVEQLTLFLKGESPQFENETCVTASDSNPCTKLIPELSFVEGIRNHSRSLSSSDILSAITEKMVPQEGVHLLHSLAESEVDDVYVARCAECMNVGMYHDWPTEERKKAWVMAFQSFNGCSEEKCARYGSEGWKPRFVVQKQIYNGVEKRSVELRWIKSPAIRSAYPLLEERIPPKQLCIMKIYEEYACDFARRSGVTSVMFSAFILGKAQDSVGGEKIIAQMEPKEWIALLVGFSHAEIGSVEVARLVRGMNLSVSDYWNRHSSETGRKNAWIAVLASHFGYKEQHVEGTNWQPRFEVIIGEAGGARIACKWVDTTMDMKREERELQRKKRLDTIKSGYEEHVKKRCTPEKKLVSGHTFAALVISNHPERASMNQERIKAIVDGVEPEEWKNLLCYFLERDIDPAATDHLLRWANRSLDNAWEALSKDSSLCEKDDKRNKWIHFLSDYERKDEGLKPRFVVQKQICNGVEKRNIALEWLTSPAIRPECPLLEERIPPKQLRIMKIYERYACDFARRSDVTPVMFSAFILGEEQGSVVREKMIAQMEPKEWMVLLAGFSHAEIGRAEVTQLVSGMNLSVSDCWNHHPSEMGRKNAWIAVSSHSGYNEQYAQDAGWQPKFEMMVDEAGKTNIVLKWENTTVDMRRGEEELGQKKRSEASMSRKQHGKGLLERMRLWGITE